MSWMMIASTMGTLAGCPTDSGSPATDTGLDLLTNGDFDTDLTGWSQRQGFLAEHVATSPGGGDAALLMDDTTAEVSWYWSDPIHVQEGQTLCLVGDTYKFDVTDEGYPNVWARFFDHPAAQVSDRVLEDANGTSIDVQTWEQNRFEPEEVWVEVEQGFTVPQGLGIEAIRVILSSNSTPTGQMYFDRLALWTGPCPHPQTPRGIRR